LILIFLGQIVEINKRKRNEDTSDDEEEEVDEEDLIEFHSSATIVNKVQEVFMGSTDAVLIHYCSMVVISRKSLKSF
jgi:hypothetical protein